MSLSLPMGMILIPHRHQNPVAGILARKERRTLKLYMKVFVSPSNFQMTELLAGTQGQQSSKEQLANKKQTCF